MYDRLQYLGQLLTITSRVALRDDLRTNFAILVPGDVIMFMGKFRKEAGLCLTKYGLGWISIFASLEDRGRITPR